MDDLLPIAFRISVLYIYALIVLRVSGKRSIDTLSPLDFVVANIISDLFDDVIWGEVPVAQGLVAFTTVVVLHMALCLAESKSDAIFRLVSGMKTIVVTTGNFVEQGLRKERTGRSDVLSQMRLQEQEQLDEVRESAWEPNGQLSVLKLEPARPAQKRDYSKLVKGLR